MNAAGVTYEQGFYSGKSEKEISDDLQSQGYDPQLINEEPNDSLAPHQHPESHILVQVAGSMALASGDQSFEMLPGDKVTIPPQVEHGAHFGPEGSDYLWVEF